MSYHFARIFYEGFTSLKLFRAVDKILLSLVTCYFFLSTFNGTIANIVPKATATRVKGLRFSNLENLENSSNSWFQVVHLLSFLASWEASKLSGLEKFNDFFFVNYNNNKYMLNSWSFFNTNKNPSWIISFKYSKLYSSICNQSNQL